MKNRISRRNFLKMAVYAVLARAFLRLSQALRPSRPEAENHQVLKEARHWRAAFFTQGKDLSG